MTETITGWHFTGATLRDGQPIPFVGEWLVHTGVIVPCKSGLHASEHPFDALAYAAGDMLHCVELRGELQQHFDPIAKWVGRERRIIKSVNVEVMLRRFAKDQALSVAHLWDMPDVVREYLEGDDASLQHEVRNSTQVAVRNSVWVVKRATARATAWTATWAAVQHGSWYAAKTAALNAAMALASAEAWDTERDAVWDTVRVGVTNSVSAEFASRVNKLFAA